MVYSRFKLSVICLIAFWVSVKLGVVAGLKPAMWFSWESRGFSRCAGCPRAGMYRPFRPVMRLAIKRYAFNRPCLTFCSSDRRRGVLTAGSSTGIFIFIAAPERC
jgi:hypothetical protein